MRSYFIYSFAIGTILVAVAYAVSFLLVTYSSPAY